MEENSDNRPFLFDDLVLHEYCSLISLDTCQDHVVMDWEADQGCGRMKRWMDSTMMVVGESQPSHF